MDGFDCAGDGTIMIKLDDDQQLTLRRPKLGEYRKFVEGITAMRDDLLDLQKDVRDRVRKENPGYTDDEVNANAQLSADDLEQLQARNLAWLRDVCRVLGDGELPADDELPVWLVNGNLSAQVIEHWQKVPSRRGAR